MTAALLFIRQCAVNNVGAIIDRPRREKFRIRIGSRRIRNSVPQRAWCSAQRIKIGRSPVAIAP